MERSRLHNDWDEDLDLDDDVFDIDEFEDDVKFEDEPMDDYEFYTSEEKLDPGLIESIEIALDKEMEKVELEELVAQLKRDILGPNDPYDYENPHDTGEWPEEDL